MDLISRLRELTPAQLQELRELIAQLLAEQAEAVSFDYEVTG